ncbi:MAG: hypothetical protein JW893_00310 [Candidatus Omnitrophica bacterium]|nr:hypothetical protein [Candidatus Omnitrophota bacterium]
MRKLSFFVLSAVLISLWINPSLQAAERVRVKVQVLTASNEGTDFNLVNDAYRDQLIELFSYSHYEQEEPVLVSLQRAERSKIDLPDGYELILTLQAVESNRVLVQALIRREGRQYVDTVLSILNPGVVFLGGPPVGANGALIIVLETGF